MSGLPRAGTGTGLGASPLVLSSAAFRLWDRKSRVGAEGVEPPTSTGMKLGPESARDRRDASTLSRACDKRPEDYLGFPCESADDAAFREMTSRGKAAGPGNESVAETRGDAPEPIA